MRDDFSDKTGMGLLAAAFIISLGLCVLRFELATFCHGALMTLVGSVVVSVSIFGILRLHFLVEPEKRAVQTRTQILIALLWIALLSGGLINKALPFSDFQLNAVDVCLVVVWLILFVAVFRHDKRLRHWLRHSRQK